MSVQIRRRGDTTAAHSNFVGAEREITIDTDKHCVVVHDGETTGGFPLAREDFANVSHSQFTAAGIASMDMDNLTAAGREAIRQFIEDKMVGTIVAAPLPAIAGFLLCDGSAVPRDTFTALFVKIGVQFGAGDGETTFNIPDYRGMFLRGLGGNSAADFATTQDDAIRNITGHTNSTIETGWGASLGNNGALYQYASSGSTQYWDSDNDWVARSLGFDASRVVPTAAENRPINKAINFFIKY